MGNYFIKWMDGGGGIEGYFKVTESRKTLREKFCSW